VGPPKVHFTFVSFFRRMKFVTLVPLPPPPVPRGSDRARSLPFPLSLFLAYSKFVSFLSSQSCLKCEPVSQPLAPFQDTFPPYTPAVPFRPEAIFFVHFRFPSPFRYIASSFSTMFPELRRNFPPLSKPTNRVADVGAISIVNFSPFFTPLFFFFPPPLFHPRFRLTDWFPNTDKTPPRCSLLFYFPSTIAARGTVEFEHAFFWFFLSLMYV